MTFDEFVTCLRDALTHLYDPDGLRYSPLTEILGLTPGVDVPMTLRQVLSEAVASLQPESDTPPGSSVWRAHDVLTYRYIHQLAQKDVARQMAVSVRHLRRMQTRALRTLATRLWTQCHLDQRVAGPEPEVADAKSLHGSGTCLPASYLHWRPLSSRQWSWRDRWRHSMACRSTSRWPTSSRSWMCIPQLCAKRC